MNPANLVLLVTAVIGSVEAVQALFDKNFRTTITIIIAAIVGAILAPHIGSDWVHGLYYGLTASGAVKVAGTIGGN